MKKLLTGSVLIWLLAIPVWSLTLAQFEALIDNQIDVAAPAITNKVNSCLALAEGCNTGWSCSSTNYCNNTNGASLCQITQDDPGIKTATMNSDGTCVVSTGTNTFASFGITLPNPAGFCIKANTYDGPGGRGLQLCYRFEQGGAFYQKCRGYGPQSSAFNVDWFAVQ